MPTIIQTHLIIAPNWEEVTKKAKNLEHIIRQCDSLTIALPIAQGTGAVPSLYSHIVQSQDQDSANLPKPFKSARGQGGKKGKVKSKPQQWSQPPPPPTEQEEQYEDVNNCYHNENYSGNSRGCRPYRGQYSSQSHIEVLSKGEGDNKIITEANTKATIDNLIPPVAAIIIITMAIIKIEVAVAMVENTKDPVVMEEAIIKAMTIINTISITHMMMSLR